MGEHIDLRAQARKKKLERDSGDRKARVSFKRYLRDLEEEQLLLDDDMDMDADLDPELE